MRASRCCWLLGGSVWVLLLGGGWHALLRHELTPGSKGRVPQTWPEASTLPLDGERPTLVLFAHRNCPCTRTTLDELDKLLTNTPGRARVLAVLLVPPGEVSDRVGADIEARARLLPEADVVVDAGGAEARRFHVKTSGHVLLYEADGHLLFSGGITDARGHAGDSAGGQAVRSWLREERTERRIAPVYGCSLFDDEGETEEAESWVP